MCVPLASQEHPFWGQGDAPERTLQAVEELESAFLDNQSKLEEAQKRISQMVLEQSEAAYRAQAPALPPACPAA